MTSACICLYSGTYHEVQWSFGAHFLLQKFLLGRPEHQSNKSILQYHMKCLDDPSDELVQSIDYGRFALGTKLLLDGSIKEMDSSGDIGLFCRGLLDGLLRTHSDRFTVIPGEDAVKLEVEDDALQGVTTMDQNVSRSFFVVSGVCLCAERFFSGQCNNERSG